MRVTITSKLNRVTDVTLYCDNCGKNLTKETKCVYVKSTSGDLFFVMLNVEKICRRKVYYLL